MKDRLNLISHASTSLTRLMSISTAFTSTECPRHRLKRKISNSVDHVSQQCPRPAVTAAIRSVANIESWHHGIMARIMARVSDVRRGGERIHFAISDDVHERHVQGAAV